MTIPPIDINRMLILDLTQVLVLILMSFLFFKYLFPDIKFLPKYFQPRRNRKVLREYKFKTYYTTEKSLKTDINAKEFASILHTGYVSSWFEDYCCNLSENRIPLIMFVNWTRSIVEDLMVSLNPINRVHGWNNYLHNMYSFNLIFHPNTIEFEDYEITYLWGGVYYWLNRYMPNFNNDKLLQQIEEVACHKKYLIPYFQLFKDLANGVEFYYSTDPYSEDSTSEDKKITAAQTALLWYAIAKQTEGDVRNKKKLAPVIHQLTGVGEKHIALKICGEYKDEDKDTLVNILGELMPNLAYRIRNIEKSNPLP